MRCPFIQSEREIDLIILLFRMMQVTRIGYHARNVREECAHISQNLVLMVHVRAAFERSGRANWDPVHLGRSPRRW